MKALPDREFDIIHGCSFIHIFSQWNSPNLEQLFIGKMSTYIFVDSVFSNVKGLVTEESCNLRLHGMFFFVYIAYVILHEGIRVLMECHN
jgi:hypothetical protein